MLRDEVIRRIKAAQEVIGRREREEGRTAGRTWAEGVATPRQLERLQAFADDPHGIDGNIEMFNNDMNRGHVWGLYECLQGFEEDIDPNELDAFWEAALGIDEKDRIEDEDFACGFVVGATEIWRQVKDELQSIQQQHGQIR